MEQQTQDEVLDDVKFKPESKIWFKIRTLTKYYFIKLIRLYLVSICSLLVLLLIFLSLLIHYPASFHRHIDVTKHSNSPISNLNGITLGEEEGELLYFIHISDTHISHLVDDRTEDFSKFCSQTLKIINPAFVLHTGDITDGSNSALDYQQNEIDWKTYRQILQDNGIFNKSYWLDLRGNHDTYGVPTWSSKTNFYQQYAVYGDQSNSTHSPYSNSFSVEEDKENSENNHDCSVIEFSYPTKSNKSRYLFLSLDMIPPTGFNALINLWGYMKQDVARVIRERLSLGFDTHNHTMLLGHYPIAAITNRQKIFHNDDHVSMQDIDQEFPFLAFLSGHLHLKDYYHKKDGFYDLEVADFKVRRMFRVMAYDHDLYSFIDVTLDQYPIILITNPKDARFISDREPLDRITTSTHIRCLIFLDSSVNPSQVEVEVEVDGTYLGVMNKSSTSPNLYTLPWDPSLYLRKFHEISISVNKIDSVKTNLKVITQTFSMDGSVEFPGFSLFLAAGVYSLPDLGYGIILAIYIYVLLFVLLLPKCAVLLLKRFKNEKYKNWNEEMKERLEYEDELYGKGNNVSIENNNGEQKHTEKIYSHHNNLLKFQHSSLLFWGVQRNFWALSHMSLLRWLFLTSVCVWILCLPNVIGPLDFEKNWGIIYFHGIRIHDEYWTVYEFILVEMVILFFMLLPLIKLTSMASYRKHYLSQNEIKNFNWRDVFVPRCGLSHCIHDYLFGSFITFFYVTAFLIGFLLFLVMILVFFNRVTLFCSPLFWIYILSFVYLFTISFREYKCIKRAFVVNMH